MGRVCDGCNWAGQRSGIGDNCPFCRASLAYYGDDAMLLSLSGGGCTRKIQSRLRFLGDRCYHDNFGLVRDAR